MSDFYAFNGSEASLAPFSVQWNNILLGTDHNGAPIYSANHTVVMQFGAASVTLAQQWLNQASGGTSINLTVLDRWQMTSAIASAVYLEITRPPAIEGIHAGPFTLTVRGITTSGLETAN